MSAFPRTMEALRQSLRTAQLDIAAFQRPLSRCDLQDCHGTCCHDGVYLTSEEAKVIRHLAHAERQRFQDMGLDLPEKSVVYGRWRNVSSGPKTAVVPFPMSSTATNYPRHFPDTRCAFLLPDAQCGLQRLAWENGRDPWYYKPTTCWMHPLTLKITGPDDDDSPPILTIVHPGNDPQRFPDYDGFVCRTPCGQINPQGQPAVETLRPELSRLSAVSGRDFLKEIEAASPAADES